MKIDFIFIKKTKYEDVLRLRSKYLNLSQNYASHIKEITTMGITVNNGIIGGNIVYNILVTCSNQKTIWF